MNALVCGAGGFIGSHLVKRLVADGYWVRGVDIEEPEFERSAAHEFIIGDLRVDEVCNKAVYGMDDVFQLAATMGGIGFITQKLAEVARDNVLINTHMLSAAKEQHIHKFFFSSSACVYNTFMQAALDVKPLSEEDAWPAMPERGYGLEKLFSEELCQYFKQDFGLETRITRFHNCYGPLGKYDGGREKAPAALCRKIASVQDGGTIEVWGDGLQRRSFLYIDDCVEGILRIMQSNYPYPINLGSDRLVSIDELVEIIARISGKSFSVIHNPRQPQGVRGRNSDNTRLKQVTGWVPGIPLEKGLTDTYRWVLEQVRRNVEGQ